MRRDVLGTRPLIALQLLQRGEEREHPGRIDAGRLQHPQAVMVGGALGLAAVAQVTQHARALHAERQHAADVADQRRRQDAGGRLAEDRPGGVAVEHVLHLVGEDPGQLLGVLGPLEQAAEDDDEAARRREGVDHRPIHDRDAERVARLGQRA
jgi:hypothetical protein